MTWEVITVRKSDLDTYLRDGWEPLNASMVQSHSFNGAPVLREFWHLRRVVAETTRTSHASTPQHTQGL